MFWEGQMCVLTVICLNEICFRRSFIEGCALRMSGAGSCVGPKIGEMSAGCQVQLTANSLKINWLNLENFRILVTFHRITNDVHQMLICIYFKLSLFLCCQYTDESFIYGLSNSLRVKLKTAFTWCHLMDPKWRDPRLLVVVTAPSHLNLTWGTAGAMPTRQSVSTSHLAAWWETMNGTHSGLCKWITN